MSYLLILIPPVLLLWAFFTGVDYGHKKGIDYGYKKAMDEMKGREDE